MPPVKNSPHKLRRPVLRKLTWCMTCLRVSIREWTECDPVALCPFSVACYAETYDGKNYRHCNSLHKPCDCPRKDRRQPVRASGLPVLDRRILEKLWTLNKMKEAREVMERK
ncbi:hypothetical protein PENPOL_c006G01762 [Penicillium polonicum]|uniref:Uncharacterized protein n=1 Tax=Penicillium polonicum TaxID=60169 RepID=A0A1V6NLJ0_PENPO|nr:hypothetical protein PENPOL_c006G01762 [Penicillium polonicum]